MRNLSVLTVIKTDVKMIANVVMITTKDKDIAVDGVMAEEVVEDAADRLVTTGKDGETNGIVTATVEIEDMITIIQEAVEEVGEVAVAVVGDTTMIGLINVKTVTVDHRLLQLTTAPHLQVLQALQADPPQVIIYQTAAPHQCRADR